MIDIDTMSALDAYAKDHGLPAEPFISAMCELYQLLKQAGLYTIGLRYNPGLIVIWRRGPSVRHAFFDVTGIELIALHQQRPALRDFVQSIHAKLGVPTIVDNTTQWLTFGEEPEDPRSVAQVEAELDADLKRIRELVS